MKIAELILVALIIVAIVMKCLFLPGGDQLLMIAMTCLSMLYFVANAALSNNISLRSVLKGGMKNVKPFGVFTAAGSGIALSIMLTGILFKLLELTGADEMLRIGGFVTAISLVLFIIRYFINKDVASVQAIFRTGIILIIGVFLLTTPSMTLIRWQYKDNPAYIKASQDYYDNPGVDSLWAKRDLEWHRVRMSKEDFEKYERDFNERQKH